jgi:AraC family ethanolamine operon transcriptional activator
MSLCQGLDRGLPSSCRQLLNSDSLASLLYRMKPSLAMRRTGFGFSAGNFASLAISIDEARLDDAFTAANLPRASGNPPAESALLPVDPTILQRLRRRATHLLDLLETSPAALGRSSLVEELTFELPIDLALAIHSADGAPPPPASRARDLALRRAVSIIADHADEPIQIRKLCEETGVGWTTLVHAFREQFGVTPKAYLAAVRLNCARRGLLEAAPEALVADVANRWGFWHMGQFAADYRRLFGELPSETRTRQQPIQAGAAAGHHNRKR